MGATRDENSLQQRQHVDQLAEQFEREFRDCQQRPMIEYYLNQPPELRAMLLKELLTIERQLRRELGQQPMIEEYRQRFPNDVASLTMPLQVTWSCPVPESIQLTPNSINRKRHRKGSDEECLVEDAER